MNDPYTTRLDREWQFLTGIDNIRQDLTGNDNFWQGIDKIWQGMTIFDRELTIYEKIWQEMTIYDIIRQTVGKRALSVTAPCRFGPKKYFRLTMIRVTWTNVLYRKTLKIIPFRNFRSESFSSLDRYKESAPICKILSLFLYKHNS